MNSPETIGYLYELKIIYLHKFELYRTYIASLLIIEATDFI